MCDVYVRNVDEKTLTLNDQYYIDVYFLYRKDKLIIELKSLIVELRVLNVNDNNIRDVITINILNLLQDILKTV